MRPLTRAPSPSSGRSATMATSARAPGANAAANSPPSITAKVSRASFSASSGSTFRAARNARAISIRRCGCTSGRRASMACTRSPRANRLASCDQRRQHRRLVHPRRIEGADQPRPFAFRRRRNCAPNPARRFSAQRTMPHQPASNSASPSTAASHRPRATGTPSACAARSACSYQEPGRVPFLLSKPQM